MIIAKKVWLQQPVTSLATKEQTEQQKLEKQMYGYFKWHTGKISHTKAWTWLEKGNLRENEFFVIVAQINAIRSIYIEAIDKGNRIASVDYVVTKMKRLIT